MAKKANQHYVPKFYFRFFSKDGKRICVLNRKTGGTIEHASIKGQASKNYFYGEESIENALSEIEGHFSTVLQQLRKSASFINFNNQNHILFLQNLMLQKSRTISARQKSKPAMDRLMQLHLEVVINNDKDISDQEKEELRNSLPYISADPSQTQLVEMKTAIECAEYLIDLLPIILINKTNRPFIFSDAPVVFYNQYQKNITLRGVLGAQTPGLIIYYPLDPRVSVMLLDKNKYEIKGLKNSVVNLRDFSDVLSLNKLQIHNAANAIFFSDYKYSEYVFELWKQEHKKLVEHKSKVNEAPGVDENQESIGDILHIYEEQLPYIPKLSFLKCSEITEEEYNFSRRLS